jgi:anti-sigma factor RsiW
MNDRDLTPAESAVLVLDEAENLIWTLLDDQLDEASSARLAKLLEEHEAVRQRYIDCVQLHVDLQDHFVDHARKPTGAKTTALPLNLTPGVPGNDASVAQS